MEIADMLRNIMGTLGKPINSNPYPDYPCEHMIISELNFLQIDAQGLTPDQKLAFEIGNCADTAADKDQYKDVRQMCWRAISLWGKAFDAYRALIRGLTDVIEDDYITRVNMARELIPILRHEYKDIMDTDNADYYKYSSGRPYLRLISNIASTAGLGHYHNIQVMGYEEILRLNNYDNTAVRFPLLMTYIECLISQKTKIKEFGEWPIRTEKDIEQFFSTPLLKTERYGCWGENYKNDALYGWYQIFSRYLKGDKTWIQAAKKEDKEHHDLMQVMLGERELKGNFKDLDKDSNLRVENHLLEPVMIKIPEFVSDLHKQLRGTPTWKPAQMRVAFALYGLDDLSPQWKSEAEKLLNEARELMRTRKFKEALKKLTQSLNLYARSIYPSTRILESGIAYAIFSNRAQCAAQLQFFDLARHDCRMALTLKSKIPHLFKMMPLIAEKYCCPKSKKFFLDLANDALNEHTDEKWDILAKKAVGRLGMSALIGERIGYSQKKIEHEETIGIMNIYTTVTFGPDEFKILPWQNKSSLEEKVL